MILWETSSLKREKDSRPVSRSNSGAEVVLTGREPAAWMQDAADYSTELRAVKHPYSRGIAAREGVEY